MANNETLSYLERKYKSQKAICVLIDTSVCSEDSSTITILKDNNFIKLNTELYGIICHHDTFTNTYHDLLLQLKNTSTCSIFQTTFFYADIFRKGIHQIFSDFQHTLKFTDDSTDMLTKEYTSYIL